MHPTTIYTYGNSEVKYIFSEIVNPASQVLEPQNLATCFPNIHFHFVFVESLLSVNPHIIRDIENSHLLPESVKADFHVERLHGDCPVQTLPHLPKRSSHPFSAHPQSQGLATTTSESSTH